LQRPRPVLQGFGQVDRLDLLAAGQVGDGAGQLKHAVVGARGELRGMLRMHTYGAAHQGVAGFVQLAELAHPN
jgi:hypothetical protein